MSKENNDGITLRRTASEIKRYRVLTRLIPAAAAVVALFLIILYIISVLYTKFGSFTVRVNKFDNWKYALTLSETRDFKQSTNRINYQAVHEVDNIDGKTLPKDLDMIDGEHNGENYAAYTFYCKNAGVETVSYEYQLYIANASRDVDKAVRVRLYVDGEYVDYARTRTDGSGPEEGTTEFYTDSIITKRQIEQFKPGDITKFTVVIWLEGPDTDCVDDLIGGEFKVDMTLTIIGIEENDTTSADEAK